LFPHFFLTTTLLKGRNKREERCCGVVQRSKSAGIEPLSIGPKQLTENDNMKQASDVNGHSAHDLMMMTTMMVTENTMRVLR